MRLLGWVIALVASAEAATITWKGGNIVTRTSTASIPIDKYSLWSDKTNWNPEQLPGASDQVVIPAGFASDKILVTGSVTIDTLENEAHIFVLKDVFTITKNAATPIGGTVELLGGDFNSPAGNQVDFLNFVINHPMSDAMGSPKFGVAAGDVNDMFELVTGSVDTNFDVLAGAKFSVMGNGSPNLKFKDSIWDNFGASEWADRVGWLSGSSQFINRNGASLTVQGESKFYAESTSPNLETKWLNEDNSDLFIEGNMELINIPVSNSGRIIISGDASLSIKVCDDASCGDLVDACVNNPCNANAECYDNAPPALDTSTGRFCQCGPGYEGSGEFGAGGCSDINACLSNPCDDQATCVDFAPPALDLLNGRSCTCNAGYEGTGEPGQCTNIDACINNPCGKNATCADINPPALDEPNGRTCTCDTGYENFVEGVGCSEIDACINNQCDAQATCQDLIGEPDTKAGRTCTCNAGYEPKPDAEIGNCKNTDACATNNGGCAPVADGGVCTDKPAPAPGTQDDNGRTCTCEPGYSGDGLTCVDIDACANPANGVNAGCSVFADCVDLAARDTVSCSGYCPGDKTGRKCVCQAGYGSQDNGLTCTDIDSCLSFPCDDTIVVSQFGTCTDLPPPNLDGIAGRTCVCNDGYEGTGEIGSTASGFGCKDLDACAQTPCDVNADCSDNSATAVLNGGDLTGRVCTCKAGFIGNGEACVSMEINADLAIETRGGIGINDIGLFYEVQDTDGLLTANSDVFSFSFVYTAPATLTINKVSFKSFMDPPFDTLPSIGCDEWTINGATFSTSGLDLPAATGATVAVTCRPGPGVGEKLGFVVDFSFDSANTQASGATGQVSIGDSNLFTPQKSTVFQYVRPVIVINTLTKIGVGIPCQGGSNPRCLIVAADSITEQLSLEGYNLSPRPELMKIVMKSAVTSDEYAATLLQAQSTSGKCAFQIVEVGSGSQLEFIVYAGGVEAAHLDGGGSVPAPPGGKDQYAYPAVPEVTLVRAVAGTSQCQDDPNGNGVIDCPTEGGVQITIQGTLFDLQSNVFVDGSSCTGVSVTRVDGNAVNNDGERILATIPEGAGEDKNLQVSATYNSAARPLVSYALPSITSLSSAGCTNNGLTTLENCARTGLDPQGNSYRLTIEGFNFGASGARVFISASECTNLQHDPLGGFQAHRKLTCDLPPGTQLLQPMILSIRRGSSSLEATVSISYAQCPPGEFENPTDKVCTPCPIGQFNDLSGRISCNKCPQGRANNNPGATICPSCTAGRYQNAVEQTDCIDCLEGKFQQATGSLGCQDCPAGFYSGTPRATGCTPCAPGTYQTTGGKSECDDCQIGFFTQNSGRPQCSQCAAGRYANTSGLALCYLCEAGTKRATDDPPDRCIECDAGEFSEDDGSLQCKQCQQGKFSISFGSETCAPCAKGEFQGLEGQQSCSPCSTGKSASNTGQVQCDECPPGKAQNQQGQETCDDCLAGSYTDVAARGSCLSCPPGQAVNYVAARSCVPCAAGKTQPTAGQATCKDCDALTFMATTGSSASQCPACPAGKFSQAGSGSCRDCPQGQFAPAGFACQNCPKGKYSGSKGAEECTLCEAGRFSNADNSNKCDECDPGDYQNMEGQFACLQCSEGTFSGLTGQSECSNCTSGSYAIDKSSSACRDCDPGRYQTLAGQKECVDCAKGSYQGQKGSVLCEPCAIGSFQDNTGQIQCRQCLEGSYQDATGEQGCKDCDVGKSQSKLGQDECEPCAEGKYQDRQKQAQCTNCARGRYTDQTNSQRCEECQAGTYQGAEGQNKCTPCPAGSYAASRATSICADCEAGRTSITNAATCDPCLTGRFAGAQRSTQCQDCPQGSIADSQGQSACSDCSPGTYAATFTRATVCNECNIGRYQDEGKQVQCKDCEAGYAASTNRSKICYQCQPGRFGNMTGMADCVDCPVGQYTATSSLLECELCETGKFQNSKSSSFCSDCRPGRIANTLATEECILCDQGTFANAPGLSFCDLCDMGKYAELTSSSKCTDCQPGEFQSRKGAKRCDLCELGKFQNNAGSQNCNDCQPGRYNEFQGQVVCPACDPGKYSNEKSAADCASCDGGTFQANAGGSRCDDCAPGKAASSTSGASTSCEDCEPGTFSRPGYTNPSGNLEQFPTAVCFSCPPGEFQSIKGSNFCKECDPGTYAVGRAETCTRCGEGLYAPMSGMRQCRSCPPNTSPASNGKECQCGIGLYGNYTIKSTSLNGETVDFREQACITCQVGQDCREKGTQVSNLGCLPGFWRSTNDPTNPLSTQCLRCRLPSHCKGGVQLDACADNRRGVLCGQCKEGYVGFEVCEQCPEQASKTTLYVIVMATAILMTVCLVYWGVLKCGAARIAELEREEEHKEKIRRMQLKNLRGAANSNGSGLNRSLDSTGLGQSGSGDTAGNSRSAMAAERSRDIDITLSHKEKHTSLSSRRAPSFLYKVKIFISFLQISRAVVKQGNVQWPAGFQAFMDLFAFVNFDFIPWNSLACLAPIDYLQKVLIFGCIPLGIGLMLLLCLFLPMYIIDRKDMRDKDKYRKARKTSRQKFWRLVLFTIFMLYPHVCAVVLGAFNCINIEDRWYLVNDMRIFCFSDDWYSAAMPILTFVLMYPIGIPLLYWYYLRRYKRRLNEPGVALQLGFLYEAYHNNNWYFECLDMLHKLAMVSLVSFLPNELEMSGFIGIGYLYLMTILLLRPYIRKGDDRVHLLTQTYIIILGLAGFQLGTYRKEGSELDATANDLLSGFLIGMVVFLTVLVFLISVKNVRKMFQVRVRSKKRAAHLATLEDRMDNSDNSKGIEMTMETDADGSSNKNFFEQEAENSD